MNKLKHLLPTVISMVCFFSCLDGGDLGYIKYEPFVVVEGKIEAGRYSSVLLTLSSSFNQDVDTAYILNHVINTAIITVSDGTEIDTLSFGRKPGLIPPYEYYGSRIRGMPGKTYTLTIKLQEDIITAETYIPEPVSLDEISFVKSSPNDTIGHFHLRFKDNPQKQQYYQIATRVTGESEAFTPCLFGTMNNTLFNGAEEVTMQINKGPVIFPKLSFDTFFITGKEVEIRFSTLPEEGYLFWNSWQEDVLNAQNPIFPADASLKSNIKGGIGIWCGYGSYYYRITPE